MSIANKIIPHYTYDDWVHWEGRWELIEGHPIAMSPSPTPKHQRVAAEIITELQLAIRASGCKDCRVYNFIDYIIADDTILEPDILIVCGEIQKKFLDFPPALIVEILSPSTAVRDINIKYEYYQQQGVKYYLIADVEKKKIDIYQILEGKYVQRPETNAPELVLQDNCAITPNFQNVFT